MRFASGLIGALFLVSAAAGATQRSGDIGVTATPMVSCETKHGYREYRFTVRNYSPTQTHVVTVFLPHDVNYGRSPLSRISRSVAVGPDAAANVSLLQCSLGIGGDGAGFRVREERRADRTYMDVSIDQHGWGNPGNAGPVILVSRGVVPAPNLGSPDDVTVGRAEHPVSQWSSDWLAYTVFDGVIVAGGEMGTMPPHVRLALVRYVECGGTLMAIGDWEPPAGWRRVESLPTEPAVYDAVFGLCIVSASGSTGDISAFMASARKTLEPWRSVEDVLDAHRKFPVVENLSVPVRGMMGLMLAFVILIGPVNLLILRRTRRRVWLFWTAPAVSLLTCGLVFGYSMLSEGLQGRYRTLSLTVLDENTGRATSIGWTAFYAPLTPGEGLHFSCQTELTPQVARPYGRYYGARNEPASARTVDWTQDQHLASGWVSARVPAHFVLRKSENRRERLTVRAGSDGRLSVVNGLGASIAKLFLVDREGRWYSAEGIPAGAATEVKAGSQILGGAPTRAGRPSLRDLYSANWVAGIPALHQRPADYLRPGTYLAVLEGNPFVESALPGARPVKCETVVFGILGEQTAGSSG
ncbi:MAG TPA: hypothetical protein VFH53_04940 [Phycisphaerae bacterium]|nr:hypothetical protein [Phycisphaerae bacterium]